MHRLTSLSLVVLGLATACRTTRPGTHVELVDTDGAPTYVSGAAAAGPNKGMACTAAIGRSVAAIALRFAQENDDVGDDVADAVGAGDGEVFLQRYAKAAAEEAAVQDLAFDPVEHVCMATVRWRPPVFLKDALLKFAQNIKTAETAGPAAVGAQGGDPAAATGSPSPSASPVAPSTPPPAPISVAPAAVAAPSVPACPAERTKMSKVLASSQGALDDPE